MKRKPFFISLIFLIILASCNTQKGTSNTLETYFYDDKTSPLQGKLTYAIAHGNYPIDTSNNLRPVWFVVTREGVYVKTRGTLQWQPKAIKMPVGYENGKIIDALVSTNNLGNLGQPFIYLIFEQSNTGHLGVLAMDTATGIFSEVTGFSSNLQPRETHFLFHKNSHDTEYRPPYLKTKDMNDIPVLYEIKGLQASVITPSTQSSQLASGDEIIGGKYKNSFLVKIKKEANTGALYQLWSSNANSDPLILRDLQTKDLVLAGYFDNEILRSIIIAKNGEAWDISTFPGSQETAANKLIYTFYEKNMNVLSAGNFNNTSVLGTSNYGYFEVKRNTDGSGTLSYPSSATTNIDSYHTKKIDTYTITGFYILPSTTGLDEVYLTTSNGVWVQDQKTKKWKGF